MPPGCRPNNGHVDLPHVLLSLQTTLGHQFCTHTVGHVSKIKDLVSAVDFP